MMETIRQWILGITGAAMIAAIARSVTPEGRTKRVVTLASGLAVMLALIAPVLTIDFEDYSQYLEKYRETGENYAAALDDENEKLTRALIEENLAAYILDKGAALGIDDLTASVTAKWGDEDCWYPYSVRLTGDCDETQRRELAAFIESELGINSENQSWSVAEDGSEQ